jgi:hypothetical protein
MATVAAASSSIFSAFSVWLVLLSDILSSRDAASDIVGGKVIDAEAFVERK